MINIEVQCCEISDVKADAVLIGSFEDKCSANDMVCDSDPKLRSLIKPLVDEGEINGKLGTTSLIHSRGEIVPKRVLCVGLGQSSELSLDRLRGMAAATGRMLRDINCKNIGIHLGFLPRDFRYKDISMAVIEGFLLGQYRFTKYLQEKKVKEFEKFGIYLPVDVDFNSELISQAIETGAIIARSTNFTRDICNEPANVLTPRKLSEIALDLAPEFNLNVRVMDEVQIKKLGMNLLTAVSAGSEQPPRLIIIEHHGAGKDKPIHGLLGKGVTFDSGGVTLKVETAMSHMHLDKTAGAVVLGIAVALSLLKARVNFTGVIPAVENMPDGRAYKPGDIIASLSGKTVEVTNTDAEGRLLMADSLTYMQQNLNINHIIDFATLTGGSKTALGSEIIPFFANDKKMGELFKEACWHSGEICWEMPLYRKYLASLSSHVAHIKNHSEKGPSTILGALFLAEFVEKNTHWMHLDIGGHEFREEEFSYQPHGATALGMRSLIRYYLHLANEDIGKDRTVENEGL
ncbi:M17 family metallopeptidase [candidate division CSSED10-310 bacterium]|uniref:Probable cytosol aminopeptidase n=1 Tax=candidate division CSSED10-310 bacterium TaxID=2855610 RepID=A0ABV6YXJ0_UNCC1